MRQLVVVTGGTRGIGLATALELARQGFALELWYRSREKDASLALAAVHPFSADVTCRRVDVSDRAEVVAALDDLVRDGRRIHGLVNNAGILEQKPFATISDADWDRVVDTNLKGVFICSQETMARMAGHGGAIVNLASSGGQLGGMLAVHYSAAKAGVISLTRSLARVGAKDNIRVNCVSPGLVVTEMTEQEIATPGGQDKIATGIPMTRAGTAAEAADAIAYLISDKASYITGQTLNVNGGLYMG